jgi:hypothetical protein
MTIRRDFDCGRTVCVLRLLLGTINQEDMEYLPGGKKITSVMTG